MAESLRTLFLMWMISSVTATNIATSAISAAPAAGIYPPADSPFVSPSPEANAAGQSPDITPLFPTTGGPAYSPADDSLPTIPSSLSPPNPDAFGPAPGPFSPLSSVQPSSATMAASTIHLLLLPGLVAWCLIQY